MLQKSRFMPVPQEPSPAPLLTLQRMFIFNKMFQMNGMGFALQGICDARTVFDLFFQEKKEDGNG